jgi:hypothetical protein
LSQSSEVPSWLVLPLNILAFIAIFSDVIATAVIMIANASYKSKDNRLDFPR